MSALPQVLGDPFFRRAIYLASPVFYELIRSKDFDWAQLNKKEQHTLAKYYNRMCFRPTPFGSFASFTLTRWGDGAPVRLVPGEAARLILKPDHGQSPAAFRPPGDLSRDTPLRCNPSLYRVGDRYRYLTTAMGDDGSFEFGIAEDEAVDLNRALFEFVGDGRPTSELSAFVQETAGCGPAEADDYIRFLAEDQVLITPAQGWIIQPAEQEEEQPEFRALPVTKPLYYAALERNSSGGGPGKADQDAVGRALQALRLLSPPQAPDAMAAFKSAFRRRFDQESVPLLQALDPDTGIVYDERVASTDPAGLLADVRFPLPDPSEPAHHWGPVRELLLQRWLGVSGYDQPIMLNETDLTILADPTAVLPPSLAVMFRKTREGLLIEQAGGVSATQLIGRFSIFSEAVHDLAVALAKTEAAANPGVLLADIGQLSDNYIDNINRRRPVYDLEIPVNVYSRLPEVNRLPLSDLWLRLRGEEMILESKSRGQRVLPRLATAFNFRHNQLALFRFLGDLQQQGIHTSLHVDLSRLFPGQHFYPRLTYGGVILSTAKWVLNSEEIHELSDNLAVFRRKRRLPRWISTGTGDQQLVLDLEDTMQVALLCRSLRHQKKAVLKEYLVPDDSVESGGEALAGQYIAFLTNPAVVYPPVKPPLHPGGRRLRMFLPGSDWLYVKLYCTPSSANVILQQCLRPLLQSHRRRIQSWFFIRYSDPQHHLRLRVRVRTGDLGQMMVALQAALKKSGCAPLVSELRYETYRRELERYGNRYIHLVEAVFHAGSVFYLDLFSVAGPDPMSEFACAVWLTHRLTGLFYPDAEEALAVTADSAGSFFQEFGGTKELRVDLDTKYRSMRPALGGWLSVDSCPGTDQDSAWQLLADQVRKILRKLQHDQTDSRRHLLADLVHMQLNRTFTQHQRQQELLVYYCLQKYLRSHQARLQ